MLKKSEYFAVNGTPIYTPDAPFPFAFGHLQGSAGRSLTGRTKKNTVRYNVRNFQNVRYSKMTIQEFYETCQLFMQESEFFNFTFYDPSLKALNTVSVYCNNVSGNLMTIEGEGLIQDVVFTLVEE
ncbi:MAG: hypothetical protein E7496_08125 [Ruminococcus sp.]|nr:hypothetical protein [Ruminococcus sp.]